MAEREPPLRRRVPAALNAEQAKTYRRLLWLDRATSLWSPVMVFLVVFLVYLVLVELETCRYHALLPILRAIGSALLVAFIALIPARLFLQPFARRRKLRRQTAELLSDLSTRLSRRPVDDKARSSIERGAQELLVASLQADVEAHEDKLSKLSALASKALPEMHKGSPFDMAKGIVGALLFALAIRAVFIEPFRIPTGSMIPTLAIGDQVFVHKFIYGVRLPFTNYVPFTIVRPPARGDIIVFENPVQPDKDYIKRIIGVPGDRIEIIDKVVHINGEAQPAEVVDASYEYWETFADRWVQETRTLIRERIDGKAHYTLRSPGSAEGYEGPYQVPPGHVFVMGDNRDNSQDSRAGLGRPDLGVQYVPFGNIKGKAMVIWLSLSKGGFLSGLLGGTGLRTDRLFTPLTLCGDEGPPVP